MTTLKVAVGVFLGIMAALVVIKYPDWAKEARQNRDGAALAKVTPETLLTKCGKPLSDKVTHLYKNDPNPMRSIEYQGKFSKITFDFLGDGKNTGWFLTGAKTDSELIAAYSENAGSVFYELPCADKAD